MINIKLPQSHITNVINMPEMPAPVIHMPESINFTMPPQPAPKVDVRNPVTVKLPEPGNERMRIVRDEEGLITEVIKTKD